MERFSRKKTWSASGGISLTATQLQDSSVTTPTSTTTPKTANKDPVRELKEDRDKHKEDNREASVHKVHKALLPMTSLEDQELAQLAHTPLPADHRPRHQLSEAEQLDQADHTQLDLQPATNPEPVPVETTQLQVSQLARTIQDRLDQPAQPDTLQPVHRNTQAPKALTQAATALQFLLQTCHRPTSHHKASHLSLTRLTPPRELRKRQPEIICHHDEDKLMQTFVYISLLPQVILMSQMKP